MQIHGSGSLKAQNGRTYSGEFVEGLKSGEGCLDYNNGDVYTGQWSMDKPHGLGVLESEMNGTYAGAFVMGMKEGTGRMIYPNGDVYEGGWRRDLYHGKGQLICVSGPLESFDGRWENGKKCGKGVCLIRGLGQLDGEFKDDKVPLPLQLVVI
jgi:hypothetical protein